MEDEDNSSQTQQTTSSDTPSTHGIETVLNDGKQTREGKG